MIPLLRLLLPVIMLVPWMHAGDAAGEPEAPGAGAGTGQVNPAVLAPLTAHAVPWRVGDRIVLVGDLLVPANQPELALRMQEALSAARPDLDLVVRGVQGHAMGLRSWQDALGNELARRPPQVVVICAGVGDALAAKNSKGQPIALAEWSKILSDMVRAARVAGAAVVIATPTILGDKPTEGPFFTELEAFAAAARSIATDTKSELCELRQPLITILATKNAKGTSEIGVLSKTFGQLRVPAMDLIAGRLATSIAAAAARIPWTIEVPNTTFASNGKAEVKVAHGEAANLSIYVTTDGSEPTDKSPPYTGPIPLTATTRVRALAVTKDGSERRTAEGWCMEAKKHAAEKVAETLPGLWVDHYAFKRWHAPIPLMDDLKPDFETWSATCDLEAIGRVSVHHWPHINFGLRFSGYFVAPYDGVYVFSTNSDDASRLLIGDTVVVRNDEQTAARWAFGAVELTKGFHSFTLVYGQGPGSAMLDVFVALPGQRQEPLPSLLLRRPVVKPARKATGVEKDEGPEDSAKPEE